MLTERTATHLGVAALALMIAFLVLVGFHLVPSSWDIPLFVAALLVFTARFILRTILARRNRQKPGETTSS